MAEPTSNDLAPVPDRIVRALCEQLLAFRGLEAHVNDELLTRLIDAPDLDEPHRAILFGWARAHLELDGRARAVIAAFLAPPPSGPLS